MLSKKFIPANNNSLKVFVTESKIICYRVQDNFLNLAYGEEEGYSIVILLISVVNKAYTLIMMSHGVQLLR